MGRNKKKDNSGQLDRRNLLKGAGLAIGAAGASLAGAAGDADAAPAQAKPLHRGYRETKDVLNYYKLARY